MPQTELAELWESQGALQMQGRRTRKDYRVTNQISDIELAAPRPLLGRNGEGKMVTDVTRDGMATVSSFALGAANPVAHPNEPGPRYPSAPPAPTPYASIKDKDEVGSRDERMAKQLLASGFSAAEAQRMMRRGQATGGRCGAVERAAGWGCSTAPIVPRGVGKKTFTDTAYETHLETHLSMPGLQLVQRPVGRVPLRLPCADEPHKLRRRLDAARSEAAADAAAAAADEEARARTLARRASAPVLSEDQAWERRVGDAQWKTYVGVVSKANSGRKPAPAALRDLRPPPRVGQQLHCSLNNADVVGSRPRGDVPPGAPGGPRVRRQRRVSNWTMNEPRVPGMRLRAGGVVGEDLAQSAVRQPNGVGMWWLPEKHVREQPTSMFQ